MSNQWFEYCNHIPPFYKLVPRNPSVESLLILCNCPLHTVYSLILANKALQPISGSLSLKWSRCRRVSFQFDIPTFTMSCSTPSQRFYHVVLFHIGGLRNLYGLDLHRVFAPQKHSTGEAVLEWVPIEYTI